MALHNHSTKAKPCRKSDNFNKPAPNSEGELSKLSMKDPQLFAHVSPADMKLEVRETHNKQLWPEPDAPVLTLTEKDRRLRIPVFNGIRRDHHWSAVVGTADEPCYLIADGISFEQFRERLVKASITP